MAARSQAKGYTALARDLSGRGWERFANGQRAEGELLALARMLWANDVCSVAAVGPLVGFDKWPGSEMVSHRAMRFLQQVIDENELASARARHRAPQKRAHSTAARQVQQGNSKSLELVPPRFRSAAGGPRKTVAGLNFAGAAACAMI